VGKQPRRVERREKQRQQRSSRRRWQHRNGGRHQIDAAVHILLSQEAFVGVERRFVIVRRSRDAAAAVERLRQVVNVRLNQEALEGERHKHKQANEGS
jgi:hypothetical protein